VYILYKSYSGIFSKILNIFNSKKGGNMIKIGINGFGRIGRFVFRVAVSKPNIEVVGSTI